MGFEDNKEVLTGVDNTQETETKKEGYLEAETVDASIQLCDLVAEARIDQLSKKMKDLIKKGNYEEAQNITKQQIESAKEMKEIRTLFENNNKKDYEEATKRIIGIVLNNHL